MSFQSFPKSAVQMPISRICPHAVHCMYQYNQRVKKHWLLSAAILQVTYCRWVCVCVCVCVLIISCVQNIPKSYERISMKFYGEVGRGLGRNCSDFGGDPDSTVDPEHFPGFFRPTILAGRANALYLSKLWMDFYENFYSGGRGLRTNRLHFGGDPDPNRNNGSGFFLLPSTVDRCLSLSRSFYLVKAMLSS